MDGVRDIGHAMLAVQLVPDHGELGRPVPRRGPARELLRVHRRVEGLRDALGSFKNKHVKVGFDAFEHGIIKRRQLVGQTEAGRRLEDRPSAGVPVHDVGRRQRGLPDADPCADRRHPYVGAVLHRARPGGRRAARADVPGRLRVRVDRTTRGTFIVDYIEGQDIMAWVSQGAIADRTIENITKSDVGVDRGPSHVPRLPSRPCAPARDPIAVVRDSARRDRAAARAIQVRPWRRVRHTVDRPWLDEVQSPGRRPEEAAHPGLGESRRMPPKHRDGAGSMTLASTTATGRGTSSGPSTSDARCRASARRSASSRSPTRTPIQDTLVAERMFAGDSLAGAKLGLTSKAKQEQMGVDEPAYGWVPASIGAAAPTGRAVESSSELIHPRVEPEFVFVMGDDLSGADLHGRRCARRDRTGGRRHRGDRLALRGVQVHAARRDRRQHVGGAGRSSETEGVAPREVDLPGRVHVHHRRRGKGTRDRCGAARESGRVRRDARASPRPQGPRPRQAGWIVMAGAPLGAEPLVRDRRHRGYSHFGDVVARGDLR